MADRRQRPQVLYVTHHLPWPAHSGGRLRESQLLSRLGRRFDIHVLAVTKTIDDDRKADHLAAAHAVSMRLFAATPVLRLSGPHVRRHGSAPARRYLRDIVAADYDVIHVEGHYLMPLLPRPLQRRAVLVEHNVESALFRQSARLAGGSGARSATWSQAALTRMDERRAWRSARVVAGVTDEDVAAIRAVVPDGQVRLVPNGADHLVAGREEDVWRLRPAAQLVFVANFAYSPNDDAARHLVQRVLPQVRAAAGAVSLALVGAGPPAWLRRAAAEDSAIKVTGVVQDVAPWLQAAAVIVAPLRLGGGIKVKLIEALAMGKAIVTTSVGAQGLRGLPPGSLIVADACADFAAAVAGLLLSPAARLRQEARARAAGQQLPGWDFAAECMAACWTIA